MGKKTLGSATRTTAIAVKPLVKIDAEPIVINTEQIAEQIRLLSQAVLRVFAGPLRRKTVLVLLAHATEISQTQIDKVLNALTDLEKTYCK